LNRRAKGAKAKKASRQIKKNNMKHKLARREHNPEIKLTKEAWAAGAGVYFFIKAAVTRSNDE
jgi:hypothetical protein